MVMLPRSERAAKSPPFPRHLRRDGRVAVSEEHFDLPAQHPLVEPERLGTIAIEIEIRNELHNDLPS